MNEKSSLAKLGTLFWRLLPVLLIVGILCVLLSPDDFNKVKKFGFVLIYFAGLPFLLGLFVLFSEKKGWLK